MFKSAEDHVFKTKKQRQLLGSKLALARLLKGYSQADALRACGLLLPETEEGLPEGSVARGFLSYVEAGIRGISKDQLNALAKLYGANVKDLTNNVDLDDHQKRMLETLRTNLYKHIPGRKQKGVLGRPRKIVAVGQTAAAKAKPEFTPPLPVAKPGPSITTGDIAILDAIRDCSEPEKVWLRDAILKLKIRMRPATAVSAY